MVKIFYLIIKTKINIKIGKKGKGMYAFDHRGGIKGVLLIFFINKKGVCVKCSYLQA